MRGRPFSQPLQNSPASIRSNYMSALKPTRVLLVDDHALVRAGIRALINRLPGIEVVAEAGDGREALRLIEQLQPDVALLDITMPALNGFEVLDYVAKYSPKIRIIILSVHEAREYATQALKAGAAGYLPKTAASSELKEAIDTVMRGEPYVSVEIAHAAIASAACQGLSREALDRPAVLFETPRGATGARGT